MGNGNDNIRSAFSKIGLSENAKRNIIAACNKSVDAHASKVSFKRITAVAVCALLAVLSVFSVAAATGIVKLNTNTNNKSHMVTEGTQHSSTVSSDGYVLSCNSVSGDKDNVYFDVIVTKKDGAPLYQTADGEFITRYDTFDAFLTFPDGHKKEVFFMMMNDSTEYAYHLEGFSLFYNDEKQYLGKEAALSIGGLTVTVDDKVNEREIICRFDEPVTVMLSVNEKIKTSQFENGEFVIYNGGISIQSAQVEAAKVYLYGECSVSGPLYDLQELLEDAWLICDGEKVPLGGKTDCGTLPDGRFTIGWLCESVIDPDKVTAICIDKKTVSID